MAVLTLSPQLKDGPHKAEPFVRACQALVEHAENFPVASYILTMLKVLDMEHQFGFPDEARIVLQESNLRPEELDDIPMEMKIPFPPRHGGRSGSTGFKSAVTSESVGDLLARWAGPSGEEPQ